MADSPLRKRQTCAQRSEAETLDKKRLVSSKFSLRQQHSSRKEPHTAVNKGLLVTCDQRLPSPFCIACCTVVCPDGGVPVLCCRIKSVAEGAADGATLEAPFGSIPAKLS
jgi:hypothetical protein